MKTFLKTKWRTEMEVSVKDKMTGSESGHRWKVKSE